MTLDPRIRKALMRRARKDGRARAMWLAYIAFLERCPVLPARHSRHCPAPHALAQ